MTEQLAHIAAGGDRLAALEALRDRLAQEIDTTMDPRAIPNLAHQFVKVLSEIDTLPARVPNAPADVIAERRRQRRAQPS